MYSYENERIKIIRVELRTNYFPQDWLDDTCSILQSYSDLSEFSNEDLAKLRVACSYSLSLAQLLGINQTSMKRMNDTNPNPQDSLPRKWFPPW